MSTFSTLYDNGQYGYMGIGPMPAKSITLTLTAPASKAFFCGTSTYWGICAYDPTDKTKYATLKSNPLHEVYNDEGAYLLVADDGRTVVPKTVSVEIPASSDKWNFRGGLTSVVGCALCIITYIGTGEHIIYTSGNSPCNSDYAAISSDQKSWFSYEYAATRFANSIDSYPIFADRSTSDANGDQIDTTYLKAANATGVKKITMSLPPVSTPVSELDFFTSGRVQCDSSDMGLLAPYPGQADSGKILQATWTGSPAVGSAIWVDKPDILKRNNAELYFHHTGDGDAYHVRKIKNNAMNHVTVSNHSGDICSLTIEAPALGADEEQNYYVVFDCYSSSGSCGVDVENASPRLLTNIELNTSSTYLKTNLANSASDAVTPEATVKDSNGDNKYLRIDSASYYGGVTETTTLAGPLVITGVTLANSTMTNTSVGFSGSPTYMIHVIGGMWELYSY